MTFAQPLTAAALALLALSAAATAQSARDPEPLVVVDVRLTDDAEAPRVGLVLRNGRISQILEEGQERPLGLRVIEGGGALALPAFIDAYTRRGVEAGEAVATQDRDTSVGANVHTDMREANRKGLRPSFRAVDVFALEDKDLEAYRAQGIASMHACPSGELLGGLSVVVTSREAALRDRVVAAEVFAMAEFRASGRGYPGTLMAYLAQLRQFFIDARWHAENLERYAAGKSDRRPPFDRELEAIQPVLRGERRLLCRADNARDVRRWLKLAREEGLSIAICGGAEAWKVAAELAEAKVPVLLDLDWGEEVEDPDASKDEDEAEREQPSDEQPAEALPESEGEDEGEPEDTPETSAEPEEGQEVESSGTAEVADEDGKEAGTEYEEPLAVRRERRKRWVDGRDCALRLHEAGVTFAFGSAGSSPKDLIKNVRALVEAGLPEDVAIGALTEVPAGVLGLEGHIGKLEVGHDADLALWSVSPFQKKAHLDFLFVDGAIHEYEREEAESGKPAEGVDLSGTWSVVYETQEGPPATLELTMNEEGAVTGSLSFKSPVGDDMSSEVEGTVIGSDFKLTSSIDISGFSAQIRIDGSIEGDTIKGDATWKYSGGEQTDAFEGKRAPQGTKETK